MAGQPRIQILVDASTQKAQQALKALGSSFDQVGKSTNALQGSWTELRSQIDLFTGAARKAGQIAVQAFEFGELGAQVNQTSDSFANLLDVIGASPDLLSQLQEAAGGTVSDLELMQSTLTLLAGTSGDFATDLANATPELLEIARAANKLNPALGSVTQQYDSLALGIKRSSPLILDNLGLTIKIGDANQAMAEKLGKSVEELTAMEKQQALLNEVLRSGETLITQAGGAAGAATDDFTKLRVAIENAKNEMAAMAADGATPVVSAVSESVDEFAKYQAAMNEVNKAIAEGIITQEDFQAAGQSNNTMLEKGQIALEMYKQAASDGRITIDELNEMLNANTEGLNEAAEVTQWLSEKQLEHFKRTATTTEAMRYYNETLGPATEGMVGLGQAAGGAADATGQVGDAALNAGEKASSAAEGFNILSGAFSGMGLAAEEAFAAQLALDIATGKLTDEEVEQKLALEGLKDAYAAGKISIQDYVNIIADGTITEAEFAAAVGQTSDEMSALVPKISETSQKTQDLTQASMDAVPALTNVTAEIDRFSGSAAEAAGQVAAVNSGMAGLPNEHTIDIYINTHGQVPSLGGGGGANAAQVNQFSAAGSDFIVPPGYPNDSYIMGVQSGERVTVTPNASGRDGGMGSSITIDLRGSFISSQAVLDQMIQKALRSADIRTDAVRRAR